MLYLLVLMLLLLTAPVVLQGVNQGLQQLLLSSHVVTAAAAHAPCA